MKLACADSYKRLLSSSMETEARLESKKKADTEAVRVFADNLRELLLAAPLGQKRCSASTPASALVARSWCWMRRGSFFSMT
jgi:uncharacterized protein